MKNMMGFRSFFVTVLAAIWPLLGHAQGNIPSATLSGTPAGGGLFNYTIILSNSSSASASIGSFWYAWIPGEFYLPTSPSSVSAPAGWSAAKFDFSGASSIQYSASSGANAIAPGSFLSFGFASTDTPSVLAGNAPNHPGTPIGRSYSYDATFFSGAAVDFVVQSVPEPSSISLLALGALAVVGARRRRVSP